MFAGLIAYILAPIVALDERSASNGTRRMPRGLAIIICYIVFIAAVVGFMFLLVPRLSRDVARLGKEAPGLYKRINEEYDAAARALARAPVPVAAPQQGRRTRSSRSSPDVPMPPGTAFTMTPLPDGRFALAARAERHRHQADCPTAAYHMHARRGAAASR